VRPRKANSLVKKNFFKGGWLHSTATVHVRIAGQHKKTAQVDGSHPTYSDVIEFILGRLQNKTLYFMNNGIGPVNCIKLVGCRRARSSLDRSACNTPMSFHVRCML